MLTFIDGNGSKFTTENYIWDAGIRDIEVPGNPCLAGPFKCMVADDYAIVVESLVKGRGGPSTDPDTYAIDILIEEDGKEIWFKRFRWETWDHVDSRILIEGIYLGETP